MNRTLYRKIKKEKENIVNRINAINSEAIRNDHMNLDRREGASNLNEKLSQRDDDANNIQEDIIDHEEKDIEDVQENRKTLKEKLRKWCLRYNPTREMCEALLQTLRSEGFELPKTMESLVHKNREKIIIRTVTPGEYCHFGIEKHLLEISNVIKQYEEIVLDVGIDGLPLFKSSGKTLWPILGRVINKTGIKVMLIGAYLGEKKPRSADTYLHDFIAEIKRLIMNGINISDKKIKFRLRAFICDAPARSYITETVGHNSLNGCSKCTQIGKSIQRVVTYSTEAADLRTDESFGSRRDLNQ